jgi:CPA2 family monovalent cation:H+ antiporter-2
MHDLPLVTTIAAAFAAAWILGLLTQRIGLSPIVGYLLAGIVIGPHTPGFVGDVHLAQQLAEIGVILLMFGVGLHFHLADLLAVKNIAVPGALFQSAVATGLGGVLGWAFDWPWSHGLTLGIALSVASTVVLMRVLMDHHMLQTVHGHVAVGWLVVEDLLTVLVLVMLPVLAGGDSAPSGAALWWALGKTFLQLIVLGLLFGFVGARLFPKLLVQVARLRSRELFTLTVLVMAVAVAAGAASFFGASMALGAFLAGMVVGQSPVSHQAAADALPMRDAFAVLFFVSVGMLFDPRFVIEQPAMVALALAIVLIGKPLAAIAIVYLSGYPVRTALTVAVGLAQIGEFSFIVADLARTFKLMSPDGQSTLIAVAILSIALNPLLFRVIDPFEAFLKKRPALWRFLTARSERRTRSLKQTVPAPSGEKKRAIVVGYGPVGKTVDRLLQREGLDTVVIDLNMDTVLGIQKRGGKAIYGEASNATLLEQAGIGSASHLVVTLPHSTDRVPLVTAARQMNPGLRILVRSRYLHEQKDLESAGADWTCIEEEEAAVALAQAVLTETGSDPQAITRIASRIRRDLHADIS